MAPTENKENEDSLSELDWLAFRYVAGELNETELEAFELRLEDDQAAREAVAGAVEIVQTVSAAEHLEEMPMVATAARQANHWRHVAWLAIAATVAACCGSVALFHWTSRQDHQPRPAVAGEDVTPASPVVASAWLETLDQPVLVTTETTMSEPVEIEPASFSADTTEMAAPDWMAAALAGMSSESGMDMERGVSAPWEN